MEDRQYFEKIGLTNGITVYSHAMDVPFFSVDVIIPVGSVHSHEANPGGAEGIAHFLEHIIFNRSELYPEKHAFEQKLFLNGGHWNAYTSPFYTNIYMRLPTEDQREGIEGLISHIFSPILDNEVDLAIERGIVMNERNQHKYYPGSSELNQYINLHWRHLRYFSKEQVFGAAALSDLTPANLKQFHEAYASNNIVVVVGGTHDLAGACSAFEKVATHPVALTEKVERPTWMNKDFHSREFRDIDTPIYFLGGIWDHYDPVMSATLHFIRGFLTNSGHGVLYNWIRKEKGWSYGVDDSGYSGKDRMVFTIEVPLNDALHVEEVRREIHDRIHAGLSDPVWVRREVDRLHALRLFHYQKLRDRIDAAVGDLAIDGRIMLESEAHDLIERMADVQYLLDFYDKHLSPTVLGEFLALPKTE